MKKSLFALAAVGAFAGAAQAQSSVTVYGVLDIGLAQTANTNTNTSAVATKATMSNTGVGSGNLATSVIGFRGTEDLGGGLKAGFHLEYGVGDVGTGANGGTGASSTAADAAGNTAGSGMGFAARLSFVSLESQMGTLRLGRQTQSVHGVIAAGMPMGTNNVVGQMYSSGSNANPNSSAIRAQDVYVNRAITYVTPKFSGATLEVQTATQNYGTNGTVAASKTSQTGAALNYSAGKFTAGLGGYNQQSTSSAGASTTTKVVGASATYDFGALKAFVAYQSNKQENGAGAEIVKTSATSVGISAPIDNATTVFASTFKGTRSGNTANSTSLGSNDLSGFQVGATYNLSKRSALYAIYGSQEIKSSTSTSKVESTGGAVGLRHTF